MNTILSSILSSIRVTALVLAVAVGISAQGAATTNQTTPTVPHGKKRLAAAVPLTPSGQNEIGLLDQAYGLLRTADHDYKGHRVHAMHLIEAAARELGGTLSGGGKGHEQQATSDSQLHSAQSLLQQAVGGLIGKPRNHVASAIKQLNIALSIK